MAAGAHGGSSPSGQEAERAGFDESRDRQTGGYARRPLFTDNVAVRIERSRENVFTVTATSQELSALVAGARMALEAMRSAPEPPPPEAIEILGRVLADFDHARERLGREPPAGG